MWQLYLPLIAFRESIHRRLSDGPPEGNLEKASPNSEKENSKFDTADTAKIACSNPNIVTVFASVVRRVTWKIRFIVNASKVRDNKTATNTQI